MGLDIQFIVYLFPVLLLLFLGVWFVRYFRQPSEPRDPLAWIREGPNLFNIPTRGKLTTHDILPMTMITVLYGVIALALLGNVTAPQTFWKPTVTEDHIVIDLGKPVQLDTVFYYTGTYHGADKGTHYELAFSEDGTTFTPQPSMQQPYSEVFSWRHATLAMPLAQTRYVRITARTLPLELGEVCLIAVAPDGTRQRVTPVSVSPTTASVLFDEQSVIPSERSIQNGSYFDEIYHARAAYEIANGIFPYEITHPPLGKEMIAVGVKLFGMTPFGWRFIGTLCGILMLPLLYLLLKQLFHSTLVSTCATILFATDFMHFTQTRIATIDVYNVLFVLLMFLFMHRYITQPNSTPVLHTLLPLFLCGLSFGLGIAAKWSCAYAGIGLVFLYVWKLVARVRETSVSGRSSLGFLVVTLLASVLFFIVIPFGIYFASYIPLIQAKGHAVSFAPLWDEFSRNQTYMFDYHSRLTDTHPYQSRWFQWIVDGRPICYFYQADDVLKTASSLSCLSNPLLAWGGLAALAACVVGFVKHKHFNALFPLICYISVMLPWMLVSRITFAYHYFPASVFLVLAFGYVFWRITTYAPTAKGRNSVIVLTCVSVVLFALFYPIISGVEAPLWYIQHVLKWIPSWSF